MGCAKDNIVMIDPIDSNDSDDDISEMVFAQTVDVVFSNSDGATVMGDNDGFFKLYSAKKQGMCRI